MVLLRDKEKRGRIRRELYEQLDTSGLPIAMVVKTLRKILAKSQEEFAEMVDVSLATLRKVEQERGNVTVATLKKILGRFSLELVVKSKRRLPET